MEIIKIPKAGDEVTLHIVKCEVVESQIKNKDGTPREQVKFTAANGDCLFIGRETAERQLSRLGFADGEMVLYGDVDGNTLRFFRTPNKSPGLAPYWNVARVTDVAAPQRGNVKTSQSTGPSIPGLDDDDGYLDSLADEDGMPPQKQPPTSTKLPPVAVNVPVVESNVTTRRLATIEAYRQAYNAAKAIQGPDSTAEALNAGAATILIAWQKVGLV